MEFQQYQKRFTDKALANGYSADQINRCLHYAGKLMNIGLPVIYNADHFSALTGYHTSYVARVADHSKYFYRTFSVPKRNGQKRIISEPLPSLKEIQLWILDNLLYRVEPSKYAKAFVPGTSLKQNVLFHRKQPVVMALDIKDFFSSINRSQITALFFRLGYSSTLADLLSKVCCSEGCLPQGAPTSPYLSNLILSSFDNEIAEYCLAREIRYTRYADDLTFSGSFDCPPLITEVKRQLLTHGFRVNEQKTRIMRVGEQQLVTGIVVNEKLQVSKKKRNFIRQQMHYIEKFGLEEHLKARKITRANYVQHLLGQVNFVLYIHEEDPEFLRYKAVLEKMA